MSQMFDEDDDDDASQLAQSDPLRRARATAMQEAARAADDALRAAQTTSRYLPWLVAVAAIAALVSTATLVYAISANLSPVVQAAH